MVWKERSHFAQMNRYDHGVALEIIVDRKNNLFNSFNP